MNSSFGRQLRIELATRKDRNQLTQREMDCLGLLRHSNATIGKLLGISTHTVGNYLKSAFWKLGAENRTAAALAYAAHKPADSERASAEALTAAGRVA